jgi:hypothetical protein
LVLAGKDTPYNMQLLFGANWLRDLDLLHRKTRITVLLDPPRGSPSYARHAQQDKDAPSPSSPRPATTVEPQKIAKIRKVQDKIRQVPGAGKTPSDYEMMAVLCDMDGGDWKNCHLNIPTYHLAVDSMDQGVQA